MYGPKFLIQVENAKRNYAEAREAFANNTDRVKDSEMLRALRITRELLRVHEGNQMDKAV